MDIFLFAQDDAGSYKEETVLIAWAPLNEPVRWLVSGGADSLTCRGKVMGDFTSFRCLPVLIQRLMKSSLFYYY